MLHRGLSRAKTREREPQPIEQTLDVARSQLHSDGGLWAVVMSLLALILSFWSLCETVLKQAWPALHVGAVMYYTRDMDGAEAFAVPVTITNSGARRPCRRPRPPGLTGQAGRHRHGLRQHLRWVRQPSFEGQAAVHAALGRRPGLIRWHRHLPPPRSQEPSAIGRDGRPRDLPVLSERAVGGSLLPRALRPSSPGLPAGCWTRACPSRSRSSRRGETRGVACNTDEAGRSKNRRVEVWLTAR